MLIFNVQDQLNGIMGWASGTKTGRIWNPAHAISKSQNMVFIACLAMCSLLMDRFKGKLYT